MFVLEVLTFMCATIHMYFACCRSEAIVCLLCQSEAIDRWIVGHSEHVPTVLFFTVEAPQLPMTVIVWFTVF